MVRVGQAGTFAACPFLPMVQWDEMDSRNRAVRVGQTGTFPVCPFSPWYSGMGWTVGTEQ